MTMDIYSFFYGQINPFQIRMLSVVLIHFEFKLIVFERLHKSYLNYILLICNSELSRFVYNDIHEKQHKMKHLFPSIILIPSLLFASCTSEKKQAATHKTGEDCTTSVHANLQKSELFIELPD